MIQQTLIQILKDAVSAAAPELGLDTGQVPYPELSAPSRKGFGDWSTNVALVVAPRLGRPPREVAQAIAAQVAVDGRLITRVEVAGPGFINLFLGHAWLHDVLREILESGSKFGRGEPRGEGVQVEYVSANPTGPLHVGTARNAALGDSLANVLGAAGFAVEREYYFNDANRQVRLYGESVEARYLERFGRPAEIPEGGYHGAQVTEVAEQIAAEVGGSLVDVDSGVRRDRILALAVERTMAGIRATLDRFGVHIDTWRSEAELRRSGAIDAAVAELGRRGYTYESDGAVFFRSTEFGDEKDRVLIRSTGEPTYFAADCAYVLDKAGRGFDHMIYVWGADHHGTVKRVMGAAQALGVDPARVEILIHQLVTLYRGGEPVRMSRRAGDYVMLDELLDEVGPDAARYTLVSRSPDSALDFDIEAVARQTMDNPVYYVQYAHARIASILRVAGERGIELVPWREASVDSLQEEAELDLLRTLAELPEVVTLAAAARAPHRLPRYAEAVAAAFHRLYTECRILTEDAARTQARLWLSVAAKQVLATTLEVIGVAAPESMERIDDGDR
jgi:arginyl-tRNA synthetase